MLDMFVQMFSYGFMRRAIIVGVLVALCAALLGVTLVLKRYSMIGDGLSHVGFGALCVALAMNVAPLAVSVPVVIISAFLLLRVSDTGKIKGDAAIALISSTSLAVGILVTSMTTGLNSDVNGYMFGSILAMSSTDVIISIVLSAAVLVLYFVFYNKIFTVTFDENFAAATGTRTGMYNTLIALLTAITVVIGMRIMGAMLISSLVIFPALTAMRVCNTFKKVVVTSAVISVVCFFAGLFISFVFSMPAGASVVAVNAVMFAIFSLVGMIKRKVS
ncbi:MAG: metal ABC transporter permease [Acutalibacteraceae bacterium]|nr:metal ABC transporter permease [Acutalibacteraceae bacterium]